MAEVRDNRVFTVADAYRVTVTLTYPAVPRRAVRYSIQPLTSEGLPDGEPVEFGGYVQVGPHNTQPPASLWDFYHQYTDETPFYEEIFGKPDMRPQALASPLGPPDAEAACRSVMALATSNPDDAKRHELYLAAVLRNGAMSGPWIKFFRANENLYFDQRRFLRMFAEEGFTGGPELLAGWDFNWMPLNGQLGIQWLRRFVKYYNSNGWTGHQYQQMCQAEGVQTLPLGWKRVPDFDKALAGCRAGMGGQETADLISSGNWDQDKIALLGSLLTQPDQPTDN